jgi:ATP-dependent RNA helicase SUPV3L1/SUV3
LRKYGVRFGAYHIYFPALLKPAARSLASLLWAQKQDVDLSALSGAQHLASSGRTSFPVDKALDRDAYRVLGYRQCGERAVRVDILERLADLIRPALAWRETSPGAKPSGAFDGRGFVVTQAMTSLTGSAGEDFASILRALGYRMDRRPPPAPKPAVAAEAVAPDEVSAQAAAAADAPADAALVDAALVDAGDRAPSAALLPEVLFAPAANDNSPLQAKPDEPASVQAPVPEQVSETQVSEAPSAEAHEVEAQAVQPSAEVATGTAAEAPTEIVAATDAPLAEASVAQVEAAAVPELVEVWRPGGRSEERRPQHDRNRRRHHSVPSTATEASANAGDAAPGEKRERHGRGRRNRHQDFPKRRADTPGEAAPAAAEAAPAQAEGAPPSEHRDGKPRSRERFEGKGRDRDNRDRDNKGKFGGERDKNGRDRQSRDKGGRDKREGGPSHRPYASSAGPRERERAADPNSPFAKLAALKEQLAANRKD